MKTLGETLIDLVDEEKEQFVLVKYNDKCILSARATHAYFTLGADLESAVVKNVWLHGTGIGAIIELKEGVFK